MAHDIDVAWDNGDTSIMFGINNSSPLDYSCFITMVNRDGDQLELSLPAQHIQDLHNALGTLVPLLQNKA